MTELFDCKQFEFRIHLRNELPLALILSPLRGPNFTVTGILDLLNVIGTNSVGRINKYEELLVSVAHG